MGGLDKLDRLFYYLISKQKFLKGSKKPDST